MLCIREAVVVEGRYDKNTLSQLVDTVILETSGFGVFKNKELAALLRRLAATRGLIVLTDSDGAGFVIRNHLKSALPKEGVKHAYIPDIPGKERRKRAPGKEGKLGVEGMSPAILEEVLRRAGATVLEDKGTVLLSSKKTGEPSPCLLCFRPPAPITKADLMALGLVGMPDSAARRAALLKKLDFPAHMTPNALLPVLNALYTREEFLGGEDEA